MLYHYGAALVFSVKNQICRNCFPSFPVLFAIMTNRVPTKPKSCENKNWHQKEEHSLCQSSNDFRFYPKVETLMNNELSLTKTERLVREFIQHNINIHFHGVQLNFSTVQCPISQPDTDDLILQTYR